MRSLTPISVFLIITSVVSWTINREFVFILAIIALVLLAIQILVFKQHKKEPIIFLNVILVIVVIIVDNIVKK